MKALTVEDLDRAVCSAPGCDHKGHDGGLFLHSKCHALSGTFARYEKGVIQIACATCGAQICTVAVARRSSNDISRAI